MILQPQILFHVFNFFALLFSSSSFIKKAANVFQKLYTTRVAKQVVAIALIFNSLQNGGG